MPSPPSIFTLHKTAADCAARRGTLRLAHATVETPVFMPVGTQGTVKAMTWEEVAELGYRLCLGNTFHLYLRPGSERVQAFGGLHKFVGWDGAMLTDSGGYQVFSLKDLRKITESGVRFQSPLDGSAHDFTPESVMRIEHELGADIIMAFDECPPYPATEEYVRDSVERTHRWLDRCVSAHNDLGGDATGSVLFGIVQGSGYEHLRRESATFTASRDTAGIAVGGVSVGEPPEEMLRALDMTMPYLPTEKPRYLMGVGTPTDILDSVMRGIDMFDCVLPTRMARNGALYTSRGRINIKNARWTDERGAIDPDCPCKVCQSHSAAYLRHLQMANEILGARLATYHNLAFYARLMENIRTAIDDGTFLEFRAKCLQSWNDEKKLEPNV
ncbi:MAG: tRNA guanosine(34) transglycosylase Tgt, partial [Armatimonadetes bacterium]|nr:tRNA guanosine(34) transglycosylase Tgt [Armatimonadota bacterium]